MSCVQNLQKIEKEVTKISEKYGLKNVAKILIVTKYTSCDKIQEIHSYNARYHFGENYVDSLIEKAKTLPQSIKWHFIGHLQSNKCKRLVTINNLYMIETIDSFKLAHKLNELLKKVNENDIDGLKRSIIEKMDTSKESKSKSESESESEPESEPDIKPKPDPEKDSKEKIYIEKNKRTTKKIRVLAQVKTASDENKTGIIHTNYEEIENLILYIIEKCEYLIFKGLMTVSSLKEHEKENCFVIVNEIKKKLLNNQTINNHFKNKTFQMSIGMSGDMELAIKHNSTQLRIGSAIFK